MKHRIKMIELMDGKKLHYPSDEELIGLNIKICVIEETLTKSEFELYMLQQGKYDDSRN